MRLGRIKLIGRYVRDQFSLLGGPALVVLIGALITVFGPAAAIWPASTVTTCGAVISALGALWANYARNLSSRRLTQKNAEIVRLNEKIVNTITGGSSVAYLVPYGGVGPIAMICSDGDFPLYELFVRVTDLEIFETTKKDYKGNFDAADFRRADVFNVRVGEMAPRSAAMLPPIFLLHGESRSWNIFFSARNGPFTQLLRMKLVNNKWEYATRVMRSDGRTVAYEKVTPDYPRDPSGQVAW